MWNRECFFQYSDLGMNLFQKLVRFYIQIFVDIHFAGAIPEGNWSSREGEPRIEKTNAAEVQENWEEEENETLPDRHVFGCAGRARRLWLELQHPGSPTEGA